LASLGLLACGDDDFANERRPAVALAITGVITEQRVEISPSEIAGGPIILTISNQTPESHQVTLVGESDDGTEIRQVTGPINPEGTAQIEEDLPPGEYRVTASSDPFEDDIAPGKIIVEGDRGSGSDDLQLP
jgi:hypothetical protein